MGKKNYILIIAVLASCIFLTSQGLAKGDKHVRKKLIEELEEISNLGTWKNITRDSSKIFLYNAPFFTEKIEIFHIEDPPTKSIVNCKLSPNYKKVAFTTNLREKNNFSSVNMEIFLINIDGSNLQKIDVNNTQDCFLIGFLGSNKLLLTGYLVEKEKYLFVLDLLTEEIEVLNELGASTVGKCYIKSARNGDLLVYDTGKAFVVYDVKDKISRKVMTDGDRPILSPNGQRILFRRGGMTGDYYIMDVDGSDKKLLLAEKKIRKLLRDSGGYRDLGFSSWSPDSRFILFFESSDLQRGKTFVLNVDTKEIVEVKPKN